MDIRIVDFAKRMATLLGLAARRHDGVLLPASYLRLCGDEFRDDAYFLQSARREARRLIDDFGVTAKSSVLDVGCGFGRLAIGLLEQLPELERYEGVDVSAAAVSWCRRYITSQNHRFRFTHVDVRNDRYNPHGRPASRSAIPFQDASFDVAYLYSVFSHMELDDAVAYLAELRRVVRRGGGVFITFHVAESGPEVVVNPGDSDRTWKGPLHCVRYRRDAIETRFAAAGFAVAHLSHATETDGQSAYSLAAV